MTFPSLWSILERVNDADETEVENVVVSSYDEQWWQSFWSFVAGAGLVASLWALQTLRNLLPDEITADDMSWVDPWNTLKEKSWQVIVENSEYINRIGELPRPKPRGHWPWETIRRRVFPKSKHAESVSHQSSFETANEQQIDDNENHIKEHDKQDQQKAINDASNIMDDDEDDDDDEKADAATSGNDEISSRENDEICIGSIFGMDVGGTLAKLVYFEQKPSGYDPLANPSRERQYKMAASAQAVFMARSSYSTSNIHVTSAGTITSKSSTYRLTGETQGRSTMTPRRRSLSLGCMGRFKDLQRQLHQQQCDATDVPIASDNDVDSSASENSDPTPMPSTIERRKSHPPNRPLHSVASQSELDHLKGLRQESVPDDLARFCGTVNFEATDPALTKPAVVNFMDDGDNDEHDDTDPPPPPMDQEDGQPTPIPNLSKIKKSQSMFNLSASQRKAVALDRFYSFARRLDSYENSVRDHQLSFVSRELGGEFHFLHFESRWMTHAMDLIRYHNLHLNISKMGATGGGAHKYAKEWKKILGIRMDKQDELDSLVAGMQFVLSTVVGDCYTFRPHDKTDSTRGTMPPAREASSISTSSVEDSESGFMVKGDQVGAPLVDGSFTKDGQSPKKSRSFLQPSPMSTPQRSNKRPQQEARPKETSADGGSSKTNNNRVDEWWWSRKVQRDAISYSTSYPYLLVTIGTGVSILRVDGPRKHERISGSTIGGGTYWGLIRLLTDVEDFEDAMRLAEKGDPAKVDMMVGDIYGDNSDALEKLGLPSDIVASSFGKLVAKEDPAAGLEQEDLARALLLMITNNIGQVAYLNAKLHNTPRIYFVGNFLRSNMLSQRRLSYAIDYWSKGEMEALFLEHEGYFGALGAFLMSQKIAQDDEGFFQWGEDGAPGHLNGKGGSESRISERKSPPYHMQRRFKTFGA